MIILPSKRCHSVDVGRISKLRYFRNEDNWMLRGIWSLDKKFEAVNFLKNKKNPESLQVTTHGLKYAGDLKYRPK